MKYTDDGYVFSSGKEFYANRGILGINNLKACIFYGYDGVAGELEDFTQDEINEIATYMICLWKGLIK